MESNRRSEEIKEELVCPVCLDYFQTPIVTPCSHVLCRGCALRLFEHNFIKCPVCRDQSYVSGGIENLPRVITLENIIERLQQEAPPPAGAEGGTPDPTEEKSCDSETVIMCQMCQGTPRRAKRSCQDCNASYCSQCLELSHPNRPPFTEHLLTEPRENPRPRIPKCNEHKEKANIYCTTCFSLGCLVCFELRTHEGHELKSLDEAKTILMELLSENIKKLESSQEAFSLAVSDGERQLADTKSTIERRRKQVTDECNSLLGEIEDKRRYFLQDLEYEARLKTTVIEDLINEYQRHSVKAMSLAQYAKELLQESDAAAFLQLAHSVNERVIIGTVQVSDIALETTPGVESGSPKAVDFRKERVCLRDLSYLRPPSMPDVCLEKCSRSWNTVILVLSPMATDMADEVVDTYQVYYSTEEEKNRGTKKVEVFKTPQEERKVFNLMVAKNASVVIIPYLQTGTTYHFSLKAVNAAGESDCSEDVVISTLDTTDTDIPVPVIEPNRSRTFTSSIQIHCAAPSQYQHNTSLEFHLLYREANMIIAPRIWKSKTMSSHGTLNHRIFGLEPNTQYEFAVLACGEEMACQLSEPVVLKTESSAY